MIKIANLEYIILQTTGQDLAIIGEKPIETEGVIIGYKIDEKVLELIEERLI